MSFRCKTCQTRLVSVEGASCGLCKKLFRIKKQMKEDKTKIDFNDLTRVQFMEDKERQPSLNAIQDINKNWYIPLDLDNLKEIVELMKENYCDVILKRAGEDNIAIYLFKS